MIVVCRKKIDLQRLITNDEEKAKTFVLKKMKSNSELYESREELKLRHLHFFGVTQNEKRTKTKESFGVSNRKSTIRS